MLENTVTGPDNAKASLERFCNNEKKTQEVLSVTTELSTKTERYVTSNALCPKNEYMAVAPNLAVAGR